MSWFGDLVDPFNLRDKAQAIYDPAGLTTGGDTPQALNDLEDKITGNRPPSALDVSMQQGIERGVGGLSNLTFDSSGSVIKPSYMGPGDVSRQGMEALIARTINDPLQQGAEKYFGNVLSGNQRNPYLDATYNQAAGKVRSSLDSQFERAGRYGGSDHEVAMGGALGDLATNLYGGQYNTDQARMMQAAQIAPGAGYAGIQRQLAAGQMQDQYAQDEANWDYDSQMGRINNYLRGLSTAQGAMPAPEPERNRLAEGLGILTSVGSLAMGNPLPAIGGTLQAGQGYRNYGGYA